MIYEKPLFFRNMNKGQTKFHLFFRNAQFSWLEMARLHALAMPAAHKSWLSILGVTDSFASGALYLFLNDTFCWIKSPFSQSVPGFWSLMLSIIFIVVNISLYLKLCVYSSLPLFLCTGYSQYLKSLFLSSSFKFIPYHNILWEQFSFSLCYKPCIPLELCISLCYSRQYIAP